MCHHTKKAADIAGILPELIDPFDAGDATEHGASGDLALTEPGDLPTPEQMIDRAVEVAVVKAIFGGNDVSRRNFMRFMGSTAAVSLIASVFPLQAAKAWAQDPTEALEKKDLKIGFLPITCASPLLAAQPLGIYDKHGLTGTKPVKRLSWAAMRDSLMAREFDCFHLPSPAPLAVTLGVEMTPAPFCVDAIENLNGNALTLHVKHKQVKAAKDLKGLILAVPDDFSMPNFLLRYYLAEEGLDPDKDVVIRIIPPTHMVLYLRSERIDGFFSPDPFNQRAVFDGSGFIFKLSKEIWPGHPCCAFSMSKNISWEMPNSFKAVLNATVESILFVQKKENRKEVAKLISGKQFLNQPSEVVEQVLTGHFPDGLGKTRNEPDRIAFNPFPWQSIAVWILTQMKRWGYLKGDVDYQKIAEQVFRTSECGTAMTQQGHQPPAALNEKSVIMGKEFDPQKPEEYVSSFAIKKEG